MNELGKKLLNEAKQAAASRKKACDDNLYQACYEGASFYVKRPVSVYLKTISFRRKAKEGQCCICGIKSLSYYKHNGKVYCTRHKDVAYMPLIKQEQVKKDEGAKIC